LMSQQDRKDEEQQQQQQSSYTMYPSNPVNSSTVTVTCSASTAGNPYSTVEHSTSEQQHNETLANLERLTNIERTIEAVSKAEQFSDTSSYQPSTHRNGDTSANRDIKPDGNSPPILGVKRRSNAAWSMAHGAEKRTGRAVDVGDEFTLLGQLVEKRVRSISKRNPRLGLTVQKKIDDCIFEASMELLEIDVSFASLYSYLFDKRNRCLNCSGYRLEALLDEKKKHPSYSLYMRGRST
uniref:SET domain-containing protein n=1 Tax=Gongylonema pulchrum TaxID=637853 RepID=A0A183D8N7_9BILA